VLRYDVDELTTVLKQAAPYCSGMSPIRLEFGPEVFASASTQDLGAFRAVVPGAVYEGEDRFAAYAPAYLLDAILAAGPEMRVRDGLKPCIVGTLDDPYRRVVLVMPVQLPTPIG